MTEFSYGDIIEFLGEEFIVVSNFGNNGIVREYFSNDNSFGNEEIDFKWQSGNSKCMKIGSIR